MTSFWILAIATIIFLGGVGLFALWQRLTLRAPPDEWLVVTENGQLVRSGVGIESMRSLSRHHIRFTSTLQRVKIDVTIPARDGVLVQVRGFVLWTVEPQGDGPLTAYRTLAIANLEGPAAPLHASPKHLLCRPQYQAFKTLIEACVSRVVARRTLDELSADPDGIVTTLSDAVRDTMVGKGVVLDQLQISSIGPAAESLNRSLAAKRETAIEAEAQHIRITTNAALAARTAEEAHRRAEERLALESAELTAALDARRRRAEAERDAIRLVNEAEEQKSADVRNAEVLTTVADKLLRAVAALPIKDAHFTNFGGDNGLSKLIGQFSSLMPQVRVANDRRGPGDVNDA